MRSGADRTPVFKMKAQYLARCMSLSQGLRFRECTWRSCVVGRAGSDREVCGCGWFGELVL